MSNKNARFRRLQRKEEAIERNEAWAELSSDAQLKVLSKRTGDSKRQIARIKGRMND